MAADETTGPGADHENTKRFDEFETVGPETGSSGGRPRTVLAGVVVVVLALLGGGAWAAYSFLDGGGPQPADVLPSSTVAVLSVDLDPSAGQKIAALKEIRKFPALKRAFGLHADDDLRKFAFDKIARHGDCRGLDFADDVEPWLGKRAAIAAVDLGAPNPSPVIALQIDDKAKAQLGFRALVDCTHPQDFAFAVGDDYLVASDTAAHAQAVLDRGAQKPLADDAAYQRWTGETGDAGVLSFYVAPHAADYAARLFDDLGGNLFDSGRGSFTFTDPASPSAADDSGAAKDLLAGFEGLGGTVRFSDGGMELAVAYGGIHQLEDAPVVGVEVGNLPGDTAAVLGFGASKSGVARMVDQLDGNRDPSSAEDETGLKLPDDLVTLLGQAVTLSLGGHAPRSLDDLSVPDNLSAGLVVHGDAAKIKAIISTLEDHLGFQLSDVPIAVQDSGDKVALSTGGYGSTLLKDGDLGSKGAFRDAVPDADKASAVLYVDFDSSWRTLLVDAATDGEGSRSASELRANTEPLRSLGLSAWQDGAVTHGLLKVTTD
jgi:hypothetical protein